MFLSYLPAKSNRKKISAIFIALSFFYMASIHAKQYTFIVQPVFKANKTKQIYRPLIQYLEKETGLSFKIMTAKSFISYWSQMKRGKFDLILDAAHFTDYRIKNMHYTVLAKIPNTVSFSLITHEDEFVLDYNELVNHDIVTLPPPSLGSVRLAQLFPNPMRQPRITSTDSASDAIKDVKNKKCFAALVPTPLLSQHQDVNTIGVTKAVPHMAFSASPNIDKSTQTKIRQALIKATSTKEGLAMLKELNLPSFQATSAKTYKGYEKLLSGVWGY